MLVLLKIPLVYLCMVVWWAIRAEPRDEQPTGAVACHRHPGRRRSPVRRPPTPPRGARPDGGRRGARVPYRRPVASARDARRGAVVSSVDETRGDRATAADTIAGLLAVGSIVLSAIAMGFGLLLQLHAHPARLAPVAIVAALVAARMSARYQSLALKAALFGAVAWVIGMVVAIVTDGPLF